MTTKQQHYINGQCLVAMPCLEESFFEKTVIYILEHNEEGAFGLIMNKTIDVTVDDILVQFSADYIDHIHPHKLFTGGPVDNQRGFVLHHRNEKSWEQQILLENNLAITSSADILQALTQGQDIGDYMMILGYSGWGPEQLEQEIAGNSWLNVNMPMELLLSTPVDRRLDATLNHLGIKYSQLTQHAGHD
jgi:putative transcriptional regulator